MKHRLLATTFSLSLVVSALSFGISEQFLTTANAAEDHTSISDNSQLWYGEAPAEVDELIVRLGDEVSKYPDHFAGVALTKDRQKVKLFAVSPEALQQVTQVAEIVNPAKNLIELEIVAHSQTELEQAKESAIHNFEGKGLLSAAIDPSNNRVTIEVENNSTAAVLLRSSTRDVDENDALYSIKDSAPFKLTYGRYDDYSRFYMGGQINGPYGKCSLGIPVTLNGINGVLTAGHCGIGSHYTPKSRFVGSTYTTSYPGNARIYGDWQILYKESYAANIFSGPAYDNTTVNLKITGFGNRYQGQEVCSSGATTGQRCRYVVEAVNQSIYAEGTNIGKLSILYHDSNRDGIKDCEGFDGGDSGGPIYSANGTGTVQVHGIITAKNIVSPGKCSYAYTMLSGVNAWSNAVKVKY